MILQEMTPVANCDAQYEMKGVEVESCTPAGRGAEGRLHKISNVATRTGTGYLSDEHFKTVWLAHDDSRHDYKFPLLFMLTVLISRTVRSWFA